MPNMTPTTVGVPEPSTSTNIMATSIGDNTTAVSSPCLTETVWKESSCSLLSLYILSLGQTTAKVDDNITTDHDTPLITTTAPPLPSPPLIDLQVSPWNSLNKLGIKAGIKPTRKELHKEVVRRSELLNIIPRPRPNQWSNAISIEWLTKNPIQEYIDCKFLQDTVSMKSSLFTQALQDQAKESNSLAKSWVGVTPYLRLIHCIIDDSIKSKFLHRNNPKSRLEIDARNSPVRELDVYEDISNLWNSPSFNPTTKITNCHEDFSSSIDVGYEIIKDFSAANPRKVKDKISSMRRELLEIIKRWEQSGQGDGGVPPDGDSENENDNVNEEDAGLPGGTHDKYGGWGGLRNRPAGALDERSNFLHNRPSYLLYFWELADEQGLLSTTLQRLDDTVGVSDGASAVSLLSSRASTPTAGSKKKKDEDIIAIDNLRKSIEKTSKENNTAKLLVSNRKRIAKLEDDSRNLRMKLYEPSVMDHANTAYKSFLEDEIKKIDNQINDLSNENEHLQCNMSSYAE